MSRAALVLLLAGCFPVGAVVDGGAQERKACAMAITAARSPHDSVVVLTSIPSTRYEGRPSCGYWLAKEVRP